MNQSNITFNSHKNHNPDCDIVCYQLDKDTTVTYGVYVNKPKNTNRVINKGDEFMEIYIGENYNVGSTKRSHSRCFYNETEKFPKKYTLLWFQLRDYYNNMNTIDLVASKFRM